jgi:hypothetical protein
VFEVCVEGDKPEGAEGALVSVHVDVIVKVIQFDFAVFP